MPVDIEYASEFRYRYPGARRQDARDLGLAVGRDGRHDRRPARRARGRRAHARDLNHMGSQLTREADGTLYTRSGREICVAATEDVHIAGAARSPCSRCTSPSCAARCRPSASTPSPSTGCTSCPTAQLLADDSPVWAQTDRIAQRCLGEGVLPLHRPPPRHARCASRARSSSRRSATSRPTAYAAGEMKHGPIALLSEDTPVVAVMNDSHVYDKVASNVQEVRARGALVIAIITEGNEDALAPRRLDAAIPRTGPSSRRCWRRCRCRSWPTASRACAGCRSTSRGTSRRPSPSSRAPDVGALNPRGATLPTPRQGHVRWQARDVAARVTRVACSRREGPERTCFLLPRLVAVTRRGRSSARPPQNAAAFSLRRLPELLVCPRRFFSRDAARARPCRRLRRHPVRGTRRASRSASTTRSTASSLFRSWLRSSCAIARSTGPAFAITRRFWAGDSADDSSTSKIASTRVSDFCACWPPGPLERDVRRRISPGGSATVRVTRIDSELSMTAILLDVDGVLHVSGDPIPGAAEAVRRLRENGHRLRFVTNNTTRSRAQLVGELAGSESRSPPRSSRPSPRPP